MSNIPSELKYTKDHEWVKLDGDEAVVGITEYAQSLLGDVVYVELPEVGEVFSAEDDACVVESVKAASDVYAPVDGEIIDVNESLDGEPNKINLEPYTDGWLFRVKMSDASQADEFMTSSEYAELIAD
jgi:glycine cleavage system H protein